VGLDLSFSCPFWVQKPTHSVRRMFKASELLGVRVLVVDDNASAREILSAMGRSFGLEVDVAQSGAEALRKTRIATKEVPYQTWC
jgi:PleD family two-component response regulator